MATQAARLADQRYRTKGGDASRPGREKDSSSRGQSARPSSPEGGRNAATVPLDRRRSASLRLALEDAAKATKQTTALARVIEHLKSVTLPELLVTSGGERIEKHLQLLRILMDRDALTAEQGFHSAGALIPESDHERVLELHREQTSTRIVRLFNPTSFLTGGPRPWFETLDTSKGYYWRRQRSFLAYALKRKTTSSTASIGPVIECWPTSRTRPIRSASVSEGLSSDMSRVVRLRTSRH